MAESNVKNDGDDQEIDEIFFDQLKDQFAFFYALTMAGIEVYHFARQHYHPKSEPKKLDPVVKS